MKRIALTLVALVGIAAHTYGFSGTITFQGDAAATIASKKGKTTTVSFTNPWKVTGGTVAYAVLAPFGQSLTMHSVVFTGDGVGAVLTASVIPQWNFTVGGVTYKFDLTLLTFAHTTTTSITMSGLGTAHIGTHTEDAVWSLIGSGTKLKFKATLGATSATGVPEGGSTAVLLGLALTGIQGVRKLVSARKA